MRILIILVLLVVVGSVAGTFWWYNHRDVNPTELVLYGNVDLRQVQLAFNNSERIAEVMVQEGDTVHKDQLLAQLDKSRLKPQVDKLAAQTEAQKQVYLRLYHGSRQEEKDQAVAKPSPWRRSLRPRPTSRKRQGGRGQ